MPIYIIIKLFKRDLPTLRSFLPDRTPLDRNRHQSILIVPMTPHVLDDFYPLADIERNIALNLNPSPNRWFTALKHDLELVNGC